MRETSKMATEKIDKQVKKNTKVNQTNQLKQASKKFVMTTLMGPQNGAFDHLLQAQKGKNPEARGDDAQEADRRQDDSDTREERGGENDRGRQTASKPRSKRVVAKGGNGFDSQGQSSKNEYFFSQGSSVQRSGQKSARQSGVQITVTLAPGSSVHMAQESMNQLAQMARPEHSSLLSKPQINRLIAEISKTWIALGEDRQDLFINFRKDWFNGKILQVRIESQKAGLGIHFDGDAELLADLEAQQEELVAGLGRRGQKISELTFV